MGRRFQFSLTVLLVAMIAVSAGAVLLRLHAADDVNRPMKSSDFIFFPAIFVLLGAARYLGGRTGMILAIIAAVVGFFMVERLQISL